MGRLRKPDSVPCPSGHFGPFRWQGHSRRCGTCDADRWAAARARRAGERREWGPCPMCGQPWSGVGQGCSRCTWNTPATRAKGAATRAARPVSVRVWGRVSLADNRSCWRWAGAHMNAGYPKLTIGCRTFLVHRVSLELALGRPLKPGMLACHTCDNRWCVRPSHLYEGTPSDNARDASQRNPVRIAVAQAMREAAQAARQPR